MMKKQNKNKNKDHREKKRKLKVEHISNYLNIHLFCVYYF